MEKYLSDVSVRSVDEIYVYLERDLRRRSLLANIVVIVKGKHYTIETLKLRELEEGKSQLSLPSFPLRNEEAVLLLRELVAAGIKVESSDEKDLRVADLKERIQFLETIVYKVLKVSNDDIRLIRED